MEGFVKKYSLLAMLSLLILSVGVHAEEDISIFKDCGIGAMVFSGEGETNRSWASVSNIVWDYGTTASSSKASGTCTRGNKKVSSAIFIHSTYESLVNETAQGNGDHLTALLDLNEVPAASREAIILSLKEELSTLVSDAGYSSLTRVEKSEAYFNIFESAI